MTDVEALLEQAVTLSADYGAEVEAAVRAASEEPLDSARAERLYTRLLHLLRTNGRADLAPDEQAALANSIRKEAKVIVDSVKRPGRRIELGSRYGLEPRQVVPVPVFNGIPIPMMEGFVDVEELDLWPENHRVELYVEEFRDRYGVDPTADQLVQLMQGTLHLPSLGDDPFELGPLARSIARQGVQRPPIITPEGEPKDGNRRIAASLLVLDSTWATPEEKERARWIRVWQAPEGATPDQIDAIVVSLNFEPEYKMLWPEYVKARLVVRMFDSLLEEHKGRKSDAQLRAIKRHVADEFAISISAVTRYIKMVRWAEDFEVYHTTDAGRDPAEVSHKANDIFQWFYEIDAGRGQEKLTTQLDQDDDLKAMVYDLMFDVLDSGAQVRSLYKVVGDPEALTLLTKAYDLSDTDTKESLRLVKEAVEEGKRKSLSKRRVGFDQFLATAVERLGAAPPDQWSNVDRTLLLDVKRVFQASIGAIDGQLGVRPDGEEEES